MFFKLEESYTSFLNDKKITITLFSLISLLGSIQLPRTFEIKSWDDKMIIDHLKEKYESRILNDGIIVIMVTGNIMPTGTTLEDNDSKSCTVMFDVLTFTPKILEIVLGEVTEVTDFGIIVRIGSVDAYIHKSQIFDGQGKINVLSQQIVSKNGSIIKVGTIVRGRITSVSINGDGEIKIGMTCKEPDFSLEQK
jgi:DNA-directed RNA polymerase subunit E'